MFGDSFFTGMSPALVALINACTFSSPCLGILFLQELGNLTAANEMRFRPHVWGFFFYFEVAPHLMHKRRVFSSPCLGILFLLKISPLKNPWPFLFSSPCLGILFLPVFKYMGRYVIADVFVPMFGDSFFTFGIHQSE